MWPYLASERILTRLRETIRVAHPGKKRILLVTGDSASAWEAISSTLGDLEIETAADPAAAEAAIRRGPKQQRLYFLAAVDLDSVRRRLDRATRTAEEAEHFKVQFMANVGHEIRTPMNAILGFSRLLLKESLGTGQKEKVQHVLDAGDALSRLIDKMLNFSKLAAGELRLSSRDFDLYEVFQDVLNVSEGSSVLMA